jgi:hypothetical protein
MTAARDEKSSDTAVDTSKLHQVASREPPNTPYHDGSELVTIRQLIELLESAVEAQGRSSSRQVVHAVCEHEKHGNSTSMLQSFSKLV